MREIKFRAWDEDNEIMYYSDKEYEDCFFGFDKGVVVGWLRQTEPQTRDEHAYDYGKPVGVVQFTGLLDENGKEAYHKDYYIRYIDGKTNSEVYCIRNFIEDTYWLIDWIRNGGTFEIVGNEYEKR